MNNYKQLETTLYNLFNENKSNTISMMKDIFPVVLDKLENYPINSETICAISSAIETVLRSSDKFFYAVPVLEHRVDATLSVTDIIYKKYWS